VLVADPAAAGFEGGADEEESAMVTVLTSVPSGWVAAGTGAAWSESYAAAGATAVPCARVLSCDAFSACCAGVSGSGMLASTRWAAGEGVVVSIEAAVGAVDGVVPVEVALGCVAVDAGGVLAVVGPGLVAIGAQPEAAAASSTASVNPISRRSVIPGSRARAPPR
jgi:hypothetical protein